MPGMRERGVYLDAIGKAAKQRSTGAKCWSIFRCFARSGCLGISGSGATDTRWTSFAVNFIRFRLLARKLPSCHRKPGFIAFTMCRSMAQGHGKSYARLRGTSFLGCKREISRSPVTLRSRLYSQFSSERKQPGHLSTA